MNSCHDDRCIRWDNICFSYSETAGRNTLEQVELTVCANRFTVITGPSGCGKSTLLSLAAGIYPANGGFIRSGTVTVDGVDPGSLPPEKRVSLLCMIFQNPDLQFCMDTVEQELIFCMENISLPVEQMDRRLSEALEFCGISHLRTRRLATLSGGEKQKAMLACTVVLQPHWLLLDEPFANIDEESAAELVGKLHRLHRECGIGIVAVDHNPDLWKHALDEWIELSANGTVCQTGNALPERFSQPYQTELPLKKSGGTAISVQNLTLRKGSQPILDGFSACFEAGKIHAILGPSGCGKSTFFHALCGMERYEGSILVNGTELRHIHRKQLVRTMGFVFQNPQDQFVADTAWEEISISLGGKTEEAKRILQEISLWRHRNLSPYMLSQGQQRRLGTAALLAYRCRILICDEPTYAQDRANVIAIMEELQHRVVRDGLTLIFSTHDRRLAESYADCIYHIKEGKLIADDQSCL